MSDNKNLAAALAAVQMILPAIRKGESATVPTKTGGKYTYNYASLPDISQAVLPLLGQAGLAWVTMPTLREDGKLVLAYRLMHSSGEELAGEYPLPAHGSPQEIGSAITYARRYTLCSVVGVAPDDDDDAQAAQVGHIQRAQEPRRSPKDRPMLDVQRKAIFAAFTRLGRLDPDEQREFLSWVAGRPLGSRGELTEDEARKALAELNKRQADVTITGADAEVYGPKGDGPF